jgi:hypothetical protein
MTSLSSLISAVLALSAFGCGDDGSVSTDGATEDTRPPRDAISDADEDAQVSTGLTVIVVSGPIDDAVPIEGANLWLETPEGLLEASSDRGGEAVFEGVDIDASGLVLTATHPDHIATTYAGFDRRVIRYHEDRGWPVSADEARMVISLERVATVALSGTVENAASGLSTLFVEPLDGDALQFRGFLSLPWTIRMSPQASTTLIGWAWALDPAPFGERGRSWTTDATFLETAADVDADGLVLDFSGDVAIAERTIAYVVPSGTPFFESALPLAALSTVTPRGQIGATVGFPLETTYDEATSVVTARLALVDPPAGEASFLTLRLEGEGSGQSSVILDWDGPPSAPIDAEFLSPPTLDGSTADGVALGERIRWSSTEPDKIQLVTYAVETATRWEVQYWGDARIRGEFPELPADEIDAMLVPGALTASVSSCEFTPELCRRIATSRVIDVSR